MKAIVCTKYGPPEVLQLQEVAMPTPKNNEVRIKILATAVTASDCIVRSFKLPLWQPMGLLMGAALGFRKPRQPILGIVVAGEVESCGPDVQLFTNGDQVFGWDISPAFGAYAEYKCMPESGMLALKPGNVDYEQAAAVPYGGLLALHFLKKGNIQPGQKVLIYGASGAVGSSAVQLARTFKAEVSGVCSTANLEWVRSLGASAVIDYTKEDFMNRGELYDLIFNAVGKSKAKLQCQKALTPHGNYVTVDDGTPKINLEDLILIKDLVEAEKLKPVVDRCYPLQEMAEAHRYVDKGHKKGNVVVRVASRASDE